MSRNTINLLDVLGQLHASASKTARHGDSLRFRFRRTSVDALPAIAELADRGASLRVYTGGLIHSCEGGRWSTKRTDKVRAWTTVEVNGVA